jgi:hypothetical protein
MRRLQTICAITGGEVPKPTSNSVDDFNDKKSMIIAQILNVDQLCEARDTSGLATDSRDMIRLKVTLQNELSKLESVSADMRHLQCTATKHPNPSCVDKVGKRPCGGAPEGTQNKGCNDVCGGFSCTQRGSYKLRLIIRQSFREFLCTAALLHPRSWESYSRSSRVPTSTLKVSLSVALNVTNIFRCVYCRASPDNQFASATWQESGCIVQVGSITTAVFMAGNLAGAGVTERQEELTSGHLQARAGL